MSVFDPPVHWNYALFLCVFIQNQGHGDIQKGINRHREYIWILWWRCQKVYTWAKNVSSGIISYTYINSCGSRGRAKGAMAPPPIPVKTSHKEDGRHRRPLIFHVSWPPPLLTMLDPILINMWHIIAVKSIEAELVLSLCSKISSDKNQLKEAIEGVESLTKFAKSTMINHSALCIGLSVENNIDLDKYKKQFISQMENAKE